VPLQPGHSGVAPHKHFLSLELVPHPPHGHSTSGSGQFVHGSHSLQQLFGVVNLGFMVVASNFSGQLHSFGQFLSSQLQTNFAGVVSPEPEPSSGAVVGSTSGVVFLSQSHSFGQFTSLQSHLVGNVVAAIVVTTGASVIC
jgi:hypothetical protein